LSTSGGFNCGTAIEMLLLGNPAQMEFRDIVYNGFGAYGNVSVVGQSCFGPLVGNIVMRCSDNATSYGEPPNKILFSGMQGAAGKGIQIDGQYCDNACTNIHFVQIWHQAPTTPSVFFSGFANVVPCDIEITEVVNDSENMPVFANFCPAITNVFLTNNYTTSNAVTGQPIKGLFVTGNQMPFQGQTLSTDYLDYGTANVGSVVSTPPLAVIRVNAVPTSLGALGRTFVPVNPAGSSVTATATGVGTMAAGTYPVCITYVGWDGGETAPSTPVYVTVNGSQAVEVTFTPIAGYQGVYVYIDTFRTNTVYTSSPVTYTNIVYSDAIYESQPELDGTGLPYFGPSGVITNNLVLAVGNAPASSGAAGSIGEIAWDATHIYVCVAANTWVRATLSTF